MKLPDFISRHREPLQIAVTSLTLHKTRSLLTMLGIVFGVGAVISMLSIGEGARRETLEQIEILGVRNIIIRSLEQDAEESEPGETVRKPMGITLKDAQAVKEVCGFAEKVAPTWETKVEARTYSGSSKATLVGATPDYAGMFNVRMSGGAFLNASNLDATANVCVIGSEIRYALFGFEDPLNRLVKIEDQWFTVLGVMEQKQSLQTLDLPMSSANAMIFIPLTTAISKFNRELAVSSTVVFGRGRRRFAQQAPQFVDRNTVDQITVQGDRDTPIEEAARVITRLLVSRHNMNMDFSVTIPDQLIEQSQKTQGIFNIVMGAIAGISLLVGGIGIMNIMLAGVLERTREIGVRRAIGATRSMIVVQFLAEATLLSIAGGIAGILLGWGLTNIITAYAGWRTIISFWSIALAFGVAAGTGILFGYYPAKRAADADIIEALRYE